MIIAGPYEFLADDPYSYGTPDAAPSAASPLPPAEEGRRSVQAQTLLRVPAGAFLNETSTFACPPVLAAARCAAVKPAAGP